MKKIILTILFCLFCAFSVSAQPSDSDKQTLKQLNENLVAAYNRKNHDEALSFARRALDLSLKLYGEENAETAIVYKNIGIIYQDKNEFRKSIENLQKSLAIYQKIDASNGKHLSGAYEALAISHMLAGNKTEAEENYLKSLEWSEKIFGKDGRETFPLILAVAKFYSSIDDLDNSDRLFLRGYEVAVKNFGKQSPQVEKIHDTRVCSNVGSSSRQKRFNELARKIYSSEDAVILNGRALSLGVPEYPPAAKAIGVTGTVPVKVWVDEQGNVAQARVVCGHPLLQSAAREAALKSKFTPVTADGKPIQVRGYITYNFQR